MRTMLTLEIAGHLDEFCPVPFLLEPYLARRDDYLVEILASSSPLSREVVEFAADRDWKWSPRTRARAQIRRTRLAAQSRARAWKRSAGSLRSR
jgi:hypothetical protein